MADAEIKMSDLEKGNQETTFNETDESTKFLPDNGDKPNGDFEVREQHPDEFYGLSREEVEQYASDPKWVKIRWILFGIFVACWILMLVAAIVIVVLEPPCPKIQDLKWYQSDAMYKINTAKFKDSDSDGVGDINGKSDIYDIQRILSWLIFDVFCHRNCL